MKAIKFIKTSSLLVTIVLGIFNYLFAQDYYPLEVGNRWDYISYDQLNTYQINYSVNVVGDSLMPNGKNYFVLDNSDPTGNKFVRADSNFIYYYNSFDSTEISVFDLNAQIGQSWVASPDSFGFGPIVTLTDKDSVNYFNELTEIYRFNIFTLGSDSDITISKKFGIISNFVTPEASEPFEQEITNLVGCIISNVTYGNLLAIEKTPQTINEFKLFQNYPNPFNPTTTISFELPFTTEIELAIYNSLGQRIGVLVSGTKTKGIHNVDFDSNDLSSGVYFYKLNSKDFSISKKLTVIK